MSRYVSHHPSIGDIYNFQQIFDDIWSGDVKQIPETWDINPNPWDLGMIFRNQPLELGQLGPLTGDAEGAGTHLSVRGMWHVPFRLSEIHCS